MKAKHQTTFALVDCNNFFVSCERIFRPDLEGRPVVVLSSNDGCAVARSNEAKDLGIPMGAPAFKYKEIFRKNKVTTFSANFELYADISRRIITILSQVTPRTEIYSIDEAFLDLTELAESNHKDIAINIRERIWNEVGIPVSIGIARSKTLAKLASEHAKKHSVDGIADLTGDPAILESILAATKIENIWGVGYRLAPKLRSQGLSTAKDLATMSTKLAKQLMGVRGQQMVSELNEESCFPIQMLGTSPKSIAKTRTFGQDTNEWHVLESAIANFVSGATFKLRQSSQIASKVGFFATTNRHKPGYKTWGQEIALESPTADPGYIMNILIQAFSKVFEPSQQYHRAGIRLGDFYPDDYFQSDLFHQANAEHHSKSSRRMKSFDTLNKKFGKGTVRYAAEDLANNWIPIKQNQSPRYTTKWQELPLVTVKKGTI